MKMEKHTHVSTGLRSLTRARRPGSPRLGRMVVLVVVPDGGGARLAVDAAVISLAAPANQRRPGYVP